MTRQYLFRFALAAVCWSLAISTLILAAEPTEKAPPIREEIEWIDVWLPDTNAKDLPHVLLVGDSITRAYYQPVADKLKGKAAVGRLATSKSVGDPALLIEVSAVLNGNHFDVIHFNNGMHGWGYTEQEYQTHFPELLETLKKGAPDAKLIWATTTAVREGDHFSKLAARTERVKERNKIAAELVSKLNIPIDDLFSQTVDHPELFGDGVHFNPQGVTLQSEQVTQAILTALGSRK